MALAIPNTPEVQKSVRQAVVTGADGNPQVYIFDRPIQRHVTVERPVFVEVPPGTLARGGMAGGAYGAGAYGAAPGGAYGGFPGAPSAPGGCGGQFGGAAAGPGFPGGMMAGGGPAGAGGLGFGPGGACAGRGAGGPRAGLGGDGNGNGAGGLNIPVPQKKVSMKKLGQKPGGGLMSTNRYLDMMSKKNHGSGFETTTFSYHDPAFGAGFRLREQNKDPLDYELQQATPDVEPPLGQLLQYSYKHMKQEDAATRMNRMLLGGGARSRGATPGFGAATTSGSNFASAAGGAALNLVNNGEVPTIGLPSFQDNSEGAFFGVFDGPASPEAAQQASRYGPRDGTQGIAGPGDASHARPGQSPWQQDPNAAVPYGFSDRVSGDAAGAGGGHAARQFHSKYKPAQTPLGFGEVQVHHPAWVSVGPEDGVRGLAWWLA